MRLIDADTLNEHFEKVKRESERLVDVAQIIGVQAVIDNQPTAYDVDKVVEQLDTEGKYEDVPVYEGDAETDYYIRLEKAVEIVKSAGNEGNDRKGKVEP